MIETRPELVKLGLRFKAERVGPEVADGLSRPDREVGRPQDLPQAATSEFRSQKATVLPGFALVRMRGRAVLNTSPKESKQCPLL